MATATITDDLLADAYRDDLHAQCTAYRRLRRRECDWAASGYCSRCGRPQPTIETTAERLRRAELEASPVLHQLTALARDFDQASALYAAEPGMHNAQLCTETARAAAQLRAARHFTIDGVFDLDTAWLWVWAGHTIRDAIKRANQ